MAHRLAIARLDLDVAVLCHKERTTLARAFDAGSEVTDSQLQSESG